MVRKNFFFLILLIHVFYVLTDMNTTLSEILVKSCVSPALLSDRLALEHMMLVAILHHKVGQEVGKDDKFFRRLHVQGDKQAI